VMHYIRIIKSFEISSRDAMEDEMQQIFPLAGAALVFLEVAGVITQRTKDYLPVGGSHVAQIAVVFGLAFVIYEVVSVLH
jgi:hypothetical protein